MPLGNKDQQRAYTMSKIITTDFKAKVSAYTVQYRRQDLRLITKLIWAKDKASARLIALYEAQRNEILTILLFHCHPDNYTPVAKPSLVMLQDDINAFQKYAKSRSV